jgi:hypothetical protein
MTQKFTLTLLNTPTYSHYTSYTQPTLATPQMRITTSGNSPAQPTTTMNPSTPYVPPFCHQTPPHTSNSTRQQHIPTNSSPNPFDNNTTPCPNNSFLQRLYRQQQPSPLAPKGGNSHQLAQSVAQQSRLYPDDEMGHAHYTRDITAWEAAFRKDSQMMFTKDPTYSR